MPKIAKELSALEVKRLAHSGTGGNETFSVAGVAGLLLQITPSGEGGLGFCGPRLRGGGGRSVWAGIPM